MIRDLAIARQSLRSRLQVPGRLIPAELYLADYATGGICRIGAP